jgi:oligopeptide/dipeptide ABC transporter ATP-binding protein
VSTTVGETPVLELSEVRKYFCAHQPWYRRTQPAEALTVKAVDDVSLAVLPGETVGLVGESGCGKTTLGRVAAGLSRPTSGTVRVAGNDVTAAVRANRLRLRRQVQVIFQDPYSSLDPRQTVARTIREPLDIHRVDRPDARRRKVMDMMERVSLPRQCADKYPAELSGGLRQRVGIATALILQPRLVIADEPTSALDASIQAEILNLLADLQDELGLSYILISHSLDVVRHLSHRVAVMYLGRVVEIGVADELFAHPKHPYTESLLSAAPKPDPRARLTPPRLRGDVPSARSVPSGCAFHPRCWLAQDECRAVPPPLYAFTPDHGARCHVTAAEDGLRHSGPVDRDGGTEGTGMPLHQ